MDKAPDYGSGDCRFEVQVLPRSNIFLKLCLKSIFDKITPSIFDKITPRVYDVEFH